MISVALAPKEIVVAGEVTSAWNILGSVIHEQLKRNTFAKAPFIRPVYDGITTRPKGAVALVLGEDSAGVGAVRRLIAFQQVWRFRGGKMALRSTQ
jgi:hypothetical protein